MCTFISTPTNIMLTIEREIPSVKYFKEDWLYLSSSLATSPGSRPSDLANVNLEIETPIGLGQE